MCVCGAQIVLEHITTEEAVQFVLAHTQCTAATITPQHLLYNRTHLFEGGRLRPHLFCLPVLKVSE
jgi:dihydroorotase